MHNFFKSFVFPVGLMFFLSTALNAQLFHDRFAIFIIIPMSLLAFISPYSGIIYIITSQIFLDYSYNAVFTNAQLGFFGWLFIRLIRRSMGVKFDFGIPVFKYWIPFILWLLFCAVVNGHYETFVSCLRSLVIAFVAYDLYLMSNRNMKLCLLSAIIGCFVAVSGYWLHKLGISVVEPEKIHEMSKFWIDDSRGFERLHFGRADANVVGSNIAAAFVGLLLMFVQLFVEKKLSAPKKLWLYAALFTVVGLSIPSLFGSMSRGAILQTLFVFPFIMLLYISILNKNYPSSHKIQKTFYIVLFPLFLFALFGVFREIPQRFESLTEYHSNEGGGLGIRGAVFHKSIDTIADNLIVGDSVLDFKKRTGRWPHNSILEIGIAAGLPGMMFYIFCIVFPVIFLLKGSKENTYLPIIGFYFCWTTSSMYYTLIDHKAVWISWTFIMISSLELRSRREKQMPRLNNMIGNNSK